MAADAIPTYARPTATIRKIEVDRPWQWLARGWADLRANPAVGLFYGVLAAVTGYLLTAGLWWLEMPYLILPLTAGFLIVGPILTVGLYEVSRRLERKEPSIYLNIMAGFRRNPSQIALMGMALLLLMIAWARIAALLFMLYFGYSPPPMEHLFAATFLAPDALPFLVIGTAVGALLSLAAFSISVVSIPLLMDRPEANVIDAITKSVEAVQVNFGPMLFWALLIAVFMVAGLVTVYLGLIVTLPLIGHASWHAYRDLVRWPEEA
jgi:uncharacterized membrane protein